MSDPSVSAQRSWNMSRVRSKNTKPEMIVRSILWGMGYRYRLKRKGLPCNPDIILGKLKTVVFVHGCFWHRHPGCKRTTTPATRTEFWQEKFRKNIARDKRNNANLEALGWNVVIIWECETKNTDSLAQRLKTELATAARNIHNS